MAAPAPHAHSATRTGANTFFIYGSRVAPTRQPREASPTLPTAGASEIGSELVRAETHFLYSMKPDCSTQSLLAFAMPHANQLMAVSVA